MSARRSIHILHVDDERRFCDLVEPLLEAERESFEVVTKTDPGDALGYLASNAVDCVVSDISERKRRERELEQYERFVEYSPDFFVLLERT